MSEPVDLMSFKEKLLNLVELREYDQLKTILNSTYLEKKLPNKTLNELIGDLINKEPHFIEHFRGLRSYHDGNHDRKDMLDNTCEYIFKNFCLYEGEEFKNTFYGTVFINKAGATGIHFLTDYRIWNDLTFGVSTGGFFTTGILSTLANLAIDSIYKYLKERVVKLLAEEKESEDVMNFGNSLPILNAKNIKRTKKNLSYNIEIETEKKLKTIKVTVEPLKFGYPFKSLFLEKKETIFSQIEQLINE